MLGLFTLFVFFITCSIGISYLCFVQFICGSSTICALFVPIVSMSASMSTILWSSMLSISSMTYFIYVYYLCLVYSVYIFYSLFTICVLSALFTFFIACLLCLYLISVFCDFSFVCVLFALSASAMPILAIYTLFIFVFVSTVYCKS